MTPAVSVILPAYFSDETIAASLEALRGQSFGDFEVIVVDSSPNERTAAIVAERFPEVRFEHSAKRLLPHEARNQGANPARGRILTFSDPDCCARSDWLERIVAAHGEGHAVVCGAVDGGGGWWNRCVHYTKYAWWLPGGRPGFRSQFASANSSLTREMWEAVGPFRGDRFAGDTDLSWRVLETGEGIWFEPRAIIEHDHRAGFREFLSERRRRGADFGPTRAEAMGWTRRRCALHAAAAPLNACVMLVRNARYGMIAGRRLSWLSTMPVQLLGLGAWCLGEAVALAKCAAAGRSI